MALLAAFQILLFRYSGQDDILIGTPIANRHRPELEGLVGFFVNTIVLRGKLHGAEGFRAVLRRARETALGAYQHQDAPFQRVVEERTSSAIRCWRRCFQVMFAFQNLASGALTMHGLTVEGVALQNEHAWHDLLLDVSAGPGGVAATFEFNADLFDAETIDALADNFAALAAIVEQPELPLARLPMVTNREEQRITRTWNETTRAFPDCASFAELFAAQVARTPGPWPFVATAARSPTRS